MRVVHYFAQICCLAILVYILCIGIKSVFRYNAFVREYKAAANLLSGFKIDNTLLNRSRLRAGNLSQMALVAKIRLGYAKKKETVYSIFYVD